MSKKQLEGLRETRFLLSSPKNAARIREALAEVKAGKLIERELDE
jgi:PHD/YefM family antitoxin component YafN of YafNO toxin-antitoxin module